MFDLSFGSRTPDVFYVVAIGTLVALFVIIWWKSR